ncbi:MAG: ribosome biogenesis GTPase Der [Magnetococcales bacterium]|nr:ribosome biogenesis GTPase Der [Magnetococcales bacterium]
MNDPLIALVGRPNVGKSTLFNRLTRSRKALVDDLPGVTRDRQYGRGDWSGRPYRVVDTGGFEEDPRDDITLGVRQQTLVAVEEADGVIFVTDGVAGLMGDDHAIADLLRRTGKPVICAVNKTESVNRAQGMFEFHQLGLESVIPIAAAHGLGIDDLLEALFSRFPPPEAVGEGGPAAEAPDRVAVIGCPNAGKSSLINRLLGEERMLATDLPGTTRDSVDLPFTAPDGRSCLLVDTAGLRRKSRVVHRLEKFSAIAALKAIDRAQVAVLVLDAVRGVTDQDQRVAGYAQQAGCGLVLAVNKWDLEGNKPGALQRFREDLRDGFPGLGHVPTLFLSAHTGLGMRKLWPAVDKVLAATRLRISTGQLNRWLEEVITRHPPPRSPRGTVKIRYLSQVAVAPPTLLFFTNRPEHIHDTYRRYLENQLRARFDFSGTPLRLLFRKSDNPFDGSPRG